MQNERVGSIFKKNRKTFEIEVHQLASVTITDAVYVANESCCKHQHITIYLGFFL